jgi:hypothetical protein
VEHSVHVQRRIVLYKYDRHMQKYEYARNPVPKNERVIIFIYFCSVFLYYSLETEQKKRYYRQRPHYKCHGVPVRIAAY